MAGKPQEKTKRVAARPPLAAVVDAGPSPILQFVEKRHRLLAVALILLGSLRIVSTYQVFSHTSDEPAHIACGVEWLANGVYTWEPQHPPLARVAVSIGPYLAGARPQNTVRVDEYSMTKEGVAILFATHNYDTLMELARLGALPFFWVGCFAVYLWGLRYFGAATGVMALFLFSFTPPVLAHAGLATTDMALTAFLTAAFLAGAVWLERPSMQTGAIFGASMGLAILAKFSTLVYFPVSAAIALACFYLVERPRWSKIARAIKPRAASFGAAVLIACLMIWAMYRFSFGHTVYGFSAPAPELFAGIKQVMDHNSGGHPSYILGQHTRFGVWYYFPVVLAVKTPIGFLLLLFLGIAWSFRKPARASAPNVTKTWMPIAFSTGILLVGLFSQINIGVRHILPIYSGFALLAALAAVRLLEKARSVKWMGAAAGILLLWMAASSLISHPDYLPYFNELAGNHPENIVVDSDLDWGQDMKRLAKRLNQAGAKSVAMLPFLKELPQGAFGLPPMQERIDALNPFPGWNAVSITIWKNNRLGLAKHPEYTPWPDRVTNPPEHVGKGILLWDFQVQQ